MILPWLTLALVLAATYTRLTRGSMLAVLGEDYIRTARSKGISERRVILRHGLRSALTPVVTQFGIDLGQLVGGVVVTETVFSLPGIGKTAIDALTSGRTSPSSSGSWSWPRPPWWSRTSSSTSATPCSTPGCACTDPRPARTTPRRVTRRTGTLAGSCAVVVVAPARSGGAFLASSDHNLPRRSAQVSRRRHHRVGA